MRLIIVVVGLLFSREICAKNGTEPEDESAPSSSSSMDEEIGSRRRSHNGTVATSDIVMAWHNAADSFQCPRVKNELRTGDTLATLSPEDISIVAALGDSLATGRGLWAGSGDVNFRGAAFPIGGDASIDGLVTIPNLLSVFAPTLEGSSHGMGAKNAPNFGGQLNVARRGATTEELPDQAAELVARLSSNWKTGELDEKWILIMVVIGTEELCSTCSAPSIDGLRKSIELLRAGIPRALVILLGPTHVASSYRLNVNLLNPRCPCLANTSKSDYVNLLESWADAFYDVQDETNSKDTSPTFGVLALPQLTIHSRQPESLFVDNQPLLNWKGHTYAAKWLWNRLLSGPRYNISQSVLSQDAYYCPSVGCPYIRSPANFDFCAVSTHDEWNRQQALRIALAEMNDIESTTDSGSGTSSRRVIIREHLPIVIAVIVVCAFLSVLSFGTYFYQRGRREAMGRFEANPGA